MKTAKKQQNWGNLRKAYVQKLDARRLTKSKKEHPMEINITSSSICKDIARYPS